MMAVVKSHEEVDFEYVDAVPFYSDGYFIQKGATTREMERLKRQAFQVTPMISTLFFWYPKGEDLSWLTGLCEYLTVL